MTYKALCQDCLRAVAFKTERAFNEVSCICGGYLCGCAGCMTVLGELEGGNLSPAGLKCAMESWSAEGGAVGAKERDLRDAIVAAPTPIREYQPPVVQDIARSLGIKNVYVSKRANEPVNTGHLSLTRRKFESVRLGTGTVVTVLQVREDSIAITFECAGLRSGSKNLQIDEAVTLDTPEGPVLIRLVSIDRGQVRLHFEADRSIKIVRTELL